jgi:tripartite-type tricarboxylate transporter receptor subunit TctC
MHKIYQCLTLIVLSLTVSSFPTFSQSSSYPERPVKLVVPFTAGGNVDISARIIGKALTDKLNQSVIIDNKPGANSMIGTEFVAKANPDGYTLLVAGAEGLVINQLIYSKKNVDALKDFTAVGVIGSFPFALVISAKSSIHSLSEFVQFAKENPNKLNYSSWGVGSTSQITFEKFKKVTNISFTHVPFQGAMPAITAVATK